MSLETVIKSFSPETRRKTFPRFTRKRRKIPNTTTIRTRFPNHFGSTVHHESLQMCVLEREKERENE